MRDGNVDAMENKSLNPTWEIMVQSPILEQNVLQIPSKYKIKLKHGGYFRFAKNSSRIRYCFGYQKCIYIDTYIYNFDDLIEEATSRYPSNRDLVFSIYFLDKYASKQSFIKLDSNEDFQMMLLMYDMEKEITVYVTTDNNLETLSRLNLEISSNVMVKMKLMMNQTTKKNQSNNSIYPVAYGILESENKKSWIWFLELLKKAIGTPNGLVISSDMQKGLEVAVTQVYPTIEHRECIRHLYSNFKRHFRGDILSRNLWRAARTYSGTEHAKILTEIGETNKEALAYINENHKKIWSRCEYEVCRSGEYRAEAKYGEKRWEVTLDERGEDIPT
ncbi:hypothetical protein QVD17_08972 [Tagetes erecta]|uniref:MULE transposase domain-containing protein n=1 Tax=Tagetes erecta TaxID=13708 RepID=A0AAD8KZN2_TARER|nr:hypothetical protein QVD17_08972 [Tagetes erecta]